MLKKFPHFKQIDQMDCGPTCLRMVAKHYGKRFTSNTLRHKANINKDGVSLLGISEAAEEIGFRTRGVKISFDQLIDEAPKPAILHWNANHFVVITPETTRNNIVIADPAAAILHYKPSEFKQCWISTADQTEELGIALLLEPTPKFYEIQEELGSKVGWGVLLGYVYQQKKFLIQILLGLLVGSILQLIFPYLTQSVVDIGINNQNLQFINVVLIAQFMLFLGSTTVEFIRSRLLLYVSTRINLSLVSDFWMKLMRLPLNYFDTKQTGDILQRLQDQSRIESFLTGSTLNTFFSLFTLVLYSFVVLQYSALVFGIFLGGSVLYFFWIIIFLRYRRKLDYKRFSLASRENSTTMQLIYGMQEIKLNGAEHLKRWEWERLQAGLFNISFQSLSLSQIQQAGAVFINQGKNILITFVVAKSVLEGQLTMGAMLAVQYIVGQINSPIEQIIGFIQQAQDAKISLERINEIHALEDEEPVNKEFLEMLPHERSIIFENVSFAYPGAGNDPVIKKMNLVIPQGKTTAIVGMSGSGKTTLLKMLLRFYESYSGEILVGPLHSEGDQGAGHKLRTIRPSLWRKNCGSVLQDGYIFNDNIAKNIAVGDEVPNYDKLLHACKVSNILNFIESLPLGFNTKIGAEGNGVSQGQKQRLLIARSVYKDPEYIFFDEATNSLDANNEKVIMENLQEFFKNRTVVVAAHRLSTVKNADKIVVMEQGLIVEQGNHEELIKLQGKYFELVRNQLELGT
ncbi:MAG: peptidase domain-containing ABC transporter [Phycisphaerales bacterium]|nr:peptidase domain-containing ABC transporter [Phycisphaerales bacterium]